MSNVVITSRAQSNMLTEIVPAALDFMDFKVQAKSCSLVKTNSNSEFILLLLTYLFKTSWLAVKFLSGFTLNHATWMVILVVLMLRLNIFTF